MGEWSFLGDILQVVNIHSTMTGRFWLLIFVIFRIMVLSTIGDNLYEDEQEAFICNTLQPGCNQVCYDKAFPMSHYRFWIFQIMVLSVPPLSFIAYAIHSQTKEEMAEKIIEKTPLRNTEEKVRWEKTKAQRRTRRYTLYVVHVVFKLVLEIGCLVSQYFVYGFTIEAHFPCERFPCPNRVDCFVSRPTEKNVFLLYYFVINKERRDKREGRERREGAADVGRARLFITMGEWSFLGDLLEAVNAHSTMTGRLWLMIFIIFRVLVIATIGDNLYEDEQEAFICNTLQPGCNQVCYDKAFPMSHFRFWVFQIVVLAAPSLSFIAFAIHSQTKEEKAERIVEKKPFQSMEEQKKWEKSRSNREARRHAMYAVHVVLKLVLEIGCLVSQYFVYGFTINAHFPCERFPCPNKVDCFVSRPTEKNVFLLYYFVVNVFSALLCFVEINLIGLKTLRRRLKHVVDTDSDEEYHHAPPSFSSAVTYPDTKRMNGHVVSVAMQNVDHLSISTRDISRQQNMSNAAHENSTSMMEPLLMEMQRQSDKSGNGLIRSRAGSQSVLST
ncbi:unnamed protein product [Lampetra fluviatilis]